MRILYWWTSSVCPTVFRRAVHVITGEFLVPRKFPSSLANAGVLVALVVMSRENMTNLHSDVVRKAHRGQGPFQSQTKISRQPLSADQASLDPFLFCFNALFYGPSSVKCRCNFNESWRWCSTPMRTHESSDGGVPDLGSCVIHISHPLCAHHAVTHPRSAGCDPLIEVWLEFRESGLSNKVSLLAQKHNLNALISCLSCVQGMH